MVKKLTLDQANRVLRPFNLEAEKVTIPEDPSIPFYVITHNKNQLRASFSGSNMTRLLMPMDLNIQIVEE